MHAELLTPTIRRTADALVRRQMAVPTLLFLAGHRPLAFVAGQTLYLLQPLGMLMGWTGWQDWAAILSHPRGAALLESLLATSTAAPHAQNYRSQIARHGPEQSGEDDHLAEESGS